MEFGVHLPQIGWEDQESAGLDRLIAVAPAAERLGFGTITANDHLIYGRPWLDGPTALASVLAAATTVRLMTSVALPIVRGPFALAKTLGALDLLSGGRLDAGLGPGSSEADYERLDSSVGGPNYVWYQFRLQVAAAELYDGVGQVAARRLFDAFRVDGGADRDSQGFDESVDDASLAARLSAAVDPKLGTFSLAF